MADANARKRAIKKASNQVRSSAWLKRANGSGKPQSAATGRFVSKPSRPKSR